MVTQGRDGSKSTVHVAHAWSRFFMRKHWFFFLTATKARREHLAIVDTAPSIKTRLQHAVSFSLPRVAGHKEEQNLPLGQPQKSKGKNLHRVPGNLIQPGWKSTEEGRQFPNSLILNLRFECSIVALKISWSELITKEAKENKKIMPAAKLSQDAADSVTYLQTCLTPKDAFCQS